MWYLKVQRPAILISLLVIALGRIASAQAADPKTEYRLISAAKTSTFEKELNDAAQRGFKVALVGQSLRLSSLTVLAARSQFGKQEKEFEYKLIGFSDFKKLKDQLGKTGFHSRGVLYPNALVGMVASPFLLLERQLAAPKAVEFEIVESKKETERQQRINAAALAGFAPVSVTHAYTLLQREANALASAISPQEYRLFDTYKVSTLEKEMNLVAKDGYCFALSGALNTVIMARAKLHQGTAQCEYRLASLSESEKQMHQVALLAKEQFRYQGITQFGAAAIFERRTGNLEPNVPTEFMLLETNSAETMEKNCQKLLPPVLFR